jgi:RNA polymerase sigma-70 factor (ECF subfamily)
MADSPGSPSVASRDDQGRDTDSARAELVEALRAQEPWAARALWDRYSPGVRRLMARALGPREDVEDLVQEVFLRVFLRVHTLREATALREFVTSVAIHVLKWALRRRWVRRKVTLSATGVMPEVVTPGVDAEARDALARCYTILDNLSANERAAFVLRYMEEMTMDEVAGALRVSLSTAKRQLKRAVAKVGRIIGNDEGLRSYFTGEGGHGFRER